MLGSRRASARAVLLKIGACAVLATVQMVAALPHALAQPTDQQIGDKKAQAEALRNRIAAQGEKLSQATEAFNQARIARERVDAQATDVRAKVAASDARYSALKAQLAQRVRLLYMHPGAPLDAWLGASSISELARKQKFGSSVLTADNVLVEKTERARQEVITQAKRLDGLREAAKDKEADLAARRGEANSAMGAQRNLLNQIDGDIKKLMEEQRAAELAAARAAAEQEAEREQDDAGDPAPPAIGDGPSGARPSPTPAPEPVGPAPPVKSGAGKAVATAAAQIGKPYEWAADGPDSFDCSGLTMYAWSSAGVSLPHSSQAQYASLPHVARSQLQPGDLVFYGSPIHHVGIYEGGGTMINAPETGEFVRRNSIDRSDYVGAARP